MGAQRRYFPARRTPWGLTTPNKMGLPPVICNGCFQVIGRGHAYVVFQASIRAGMSPEEALDAIKVKRDCCRCMILSHVEDLGLVLAAAAAARAAARVGAAGST